MIIKSRKCAATFQFVEFIFWFHLLIIVNKSSSTELAEHNIQQENGEQRKSLSSDVKNNNNGLTTVQPFEFSMHKTFNEDHEERKSSEVQDVSDVIIVKSSKIYSEDDERQKLPSNGDNDDVSRINETSSNHKSLNENGKERKLSTDVGNEADNSIIIQPSEFVGGKVSLEDDEGGKFLSDIESNETGSKITDLFEFSKHNNLNESGEERQLSSEADDVNNSRIVEQFQISREKIKEKNDEESKSLVVEDNTSDSQIAQLFEFEEGKSPIENREGRGLSSDSEVNANDSRIIQPTQITKHKNSNNNGEGRQLLPDAESDDNGPRIIPNPDKAYTASENFLEKIQEHCKSQQALSLICNNLKLVIPISSQKIPDDFKKLDETVTQTVLPDEQTEIENIRSDRRYNKHKNPFTPESLKHIPDYYESSHNAKNIQVKELSMNTNDKIPTAYRQHLEEVYGYIYTTQLPISDNFYTIDYAETNPEDSKFNYNPVSSKDNIPNHSNYQNNHKDSNTNVYETVGEATGDLIEREKMEEQENVNKPADYMATKTSLDNIPAIEQRIYEQNTAKPSEKNEFITPDSHDIPDFDDEEEDGNIDDEFTAEESSNLRGKDAKIPQYLAEKRQETELENKIQWKTNITGKNDTEILSNQPIRTMMQRFVESSLTKIFKNSSTIKFPTFETVINKVKDWFELMFGRNRDEARGKLKKMYNPLLIGLFIKGIILITTAAGFLLKVFLAKAVFFSFATFLMAGIIVFKKFSTPQGGTIYLNTGSSPAIKTSANWDKDGFISMNNPQRALKNVGSFTVVEGNRRKADYSTSDSADRYHQYYNAYYKPSNEFYTTTMSPFGT